MSGRNNKKFKLAVCLLAIFGVSIFGIQQTKAVDVNNQGGLENINNYTRGEDINITRDINLNSANLPDITGAINAVVNGNNNTISGSIFNSDADRTLTFGHYTLQDNSSLTFNNINFQTDTTIQGTQDWQSRAWTVAGLIAQNMASTSTVNINFSDFINNNVYLYQDRSGHNMDLQNYINGGLLNNAGKMNITSSDFNNNTIRVATYKDETSLLQDGYAHAEMYGGIITNYETGVLTINGNGTASMSNNNISAYSESSTDRDPVHAIVQGGVINNEGEALINGVQINNNTVTASTNNYGDNATAQGGAIYNAQGGSLTIQGNTSFAGNSVNASGANSNTAQGGAIYNAGAINVSGGNVTFSNNSANNAANDIYFADGSTMNLTGNSTVELGSGVQSANQTATISVEGGSNLIQANTNSGGFSGVINIASNGLLTYKGDTVNSALMNSFSNADINLSENSGLGFDSDNNFTLDVDDIISSHDTITPNGTLNIYKFGNGEMTLAGDFDGVSDEYFVEGGKLIASNSNISNQDTITVNNSSEFEYRAGIGDNINHNVILNNSTYTIEANDRSVTVNSAPSIMGNNTINLNNGTYTLNTDFSSTEGTADVNVSNSTLQFGTAGGINQNTTITNSTLNLANDTISTTEFANLVSNGTNNLNIDIDLTNNTSDIINAGASSSGQITLNDINFIGEAYQTEYSFNVIQGNGSLAFNNYSGTIESSVYKYTVGASGQTITLNATGISDNGLKYYNHTLTDDRTFTFVGDEVYTIAEDLESTNAGDFIVQGKENTNAQANVISGGDLYSFFEVNSDKLTVNNVTIQDANANNLDEPLEGSSLNTSGGVLNISGGSAEFNNVVLNSNTAYNSGGAIYSSGGTTTINNSTISDNTSGTGGAIAAGGGEITINGSSITGNSAAYGGAINSAGDDAKITVNDSVISNNSATGDGSAIYNAMGSTVNLNDVTITGNTGNSSIYNTGSNSTINIVNDNTNTVNNNSVIKNTGKINITANNGSTTTIQDAIQNLDTANDTLGNIETTGNIIFSDITKQNIEQNDSQVTVKNLSDSTYIKNKGVLAATTVSNSTITTLQNQGNMNFLDLGTVKEGSIINANDGETIIVTLDASRVNAGENTISTSITTVQNNSTVNLSGGENTIETVNSSTVETSGNTTETTIKTASNNSSIINQSGTVNITTLVSSDENTSPSTFTQNGGNSTIQNAINSTVDINGGESALITGSNLTISVDNGELNIGAPNPSEGQDYLSNSGLTIGNGASVNLTGGNISGGTINLAASTAQEGDETNEGKLNLADDETIISSALKGGGTINKTSGGKLTLENTNNSQFKGNINVANGGILTFDQDSMLSSDADINLNNSTFNFDLTNAENISLTDTGFSTVNLTNSSTMNVDGTGLNQDIQIQVGNGFWTSDNSGNTLNFSNANYNLINEQGESQSASDRLSFENANLSLQANQTWENEIVLDDTYLNLSNQSAGDTYHFSNLNVINNEDGSANNSLSVDVDFVYDKAAGTSPSADKIIVDKGSGIFELTRLFITDDNGQIANYDSPIQIIQNNNGASVQLAVEEGIEVLSWATNVYEYSIDSASSTGEGGLVDSIEVNPDGVSSTDTLRDLNHYGANRGFSFVTKDLSGAQVENEYHIYRDLDTTAEGTFSVIGQVIDGEKSVLSGELKELVIDENDPRYHDNTYDYLGPEQADGQRPVVDTATVDTPPDLAEGEYTFAIGAMDSDDKAKGSLFELTNATDLYITDVRIEDTLRTNSDSIKNGAAIYANNQDATVQLDNVDFVGNIANALNDDGTGASNGGAIANELSKSFLINGSMLASNTASNDGGAIYNTSSGLTIENATFYANSAGNRGGAIYTSSDMKIINSNFGVDTAGVQNLNRANGVHNDIYIDNNATLTFEVNNTQTASTIRSGIAGGGTFEKTSEGTLNLSGNNQGFTGEFKIADNGGKVLYNAASSVDDSFVSGDVSIGENSTLEMNISNGVSNQNINNVSGSGALNKTGEGTLNLGGDNSAFEGKTQIQTGILNYIADNDTDRLFGVNSTTSIFKGAQFNINVNENIQNQTLYNIEGSGTVNKLENGTLYISGANSGFEGAMNVQAGTVQYNNVSGNSPQNTSYIQGTTTLYNGTEFIVNVDGASNFTDTFKGDFASYNAQSSANFTKTGGGTLSLTGDLKNLNADVSIQNGILEFVKNENNGYINGDTTVNSGTFIYDTNGKDAELSNNITGAGNFTKEGKGTLTINGDYSGMTGNAAIEEGILKYIAGNGNYFGGHTLINSNGELIIDTKGNNITVSNISQSEQTGGTFRKEGEGTLTLSGANGSFNGNSYIDEGTLAFSNADGSTYFAGATTIADGAILAYTTGTDATLSNVLGQGTLQKLGSAALEFNYVNADNKKFEGEAVVDNGTLTVNAANDANSNFDFDMTVNNGNLVYNAAQNQNYNIGTVDSKVSFGENANNATITFNGGNYNLAGDIQNAVNNITNFTDATLTLGSENYNGNYKLSGGNVDLSDNVYSHHTFNNLEALNTNLSLDLGFKNPADEKMYDKITVNSGDASFNVISVNMIPSDGVNSSDGSASDSGENETLTFNVLGGEATFNSGNSLTSYATNKYTYDVTYEDGQNIVFTKTGNSDSNTLKRQNINEIDDIREFQFDSDINAGNPYQLDEDLTETNDGRFTVIGYDDGSVTAGNPITTVDGRDNYSMFEVGNDTKLNVSDIHFTNANATDNDIDGTDKYSDSIHGSILALMGGSATLDNVKATNNESEGFGGAIYANNGELVLNDIYFENNVHKQGNGTEADNDIYVTGNADVSITGDSVVKSGLAGDGTINAYDNFELTGNNKDFTGTLNVIGNTEFVQESADDSYISGTTVINRGAQLMLDNDYNDIEATFAGSGGELIKEGANDLILTGDNSSMTGNVIVNEGNIILNTDNAAYFGGSTELASGTGIEINGSKDALLSNVEGASDTTITKDGSGKLTLDGNNGYDGSLLMNNGTFGLGYNSNYTIANAVFNNGTSINLQNTAAVYENGSWTTNPDPAGIESVSFDNLTLNGDIGLYLDVDLKNGQADTISANNVSGDGLIILGSDGINAVTDALVENTSVKIASGAITDYIQLAEDDMEIMGPIQEYLVNYNDGMLNFTATGGDHPSYNQVNPGIMSGAVAAQMGGYLTQLNSYDEAFRNMDMYMLMTKKQRDAMKYRNKYAYNGSSGIIYDASISRQENKSGWLRPFATFEQVDLDGGPDVSNVAYGSYFGIDSEFIDLGHGWDGVWSAYAGYNGSHQAYDGIGIYQNGGTLGVVGMAYKGNFFTGLTVNAGASAGRANVDAGYDDFTMLMSGVASKTGYNFELFDGKFIIQPSYMMSYSFVNTFDYTSASGVRVTSDPLHAIHIEPGIKFIGNLKNGWQPYMGISMIWNVMDKTKFMANEVYLPELSIKPFVKYGVGLRKSWGERFTGYLQTYITNGGRNGIGLQAGFNWALGKPVERQRQAFGIVPKVESVKFVKK